VAVEAQDVIVEQVAADEVPDVEGGVLAEPLEPLGVFAVLGVDALALVDDVGAAELGGEDFEAEAGVALGTGVFTRGEGDVVGVREDADSFGGKGR
jgi:hypothetical protein